MLSFTHPAWLSYLHILRSCISNKLILNHFISVVNLVQSGVRLEVLEHALWTAVHWSLTILLLSGSVQINWEPGNSLAAFHNLQFLVAGLLSHAKPQKLINIAKINAFRSRKVSYSNAYGSLTTQQALAWPFMLSLTEKLKPCGHI